MQKLHMFLSSTREAVFFQDVCCCRQNRLIIPCEDPVAQKPAEKEQTRKKTHRRWSIVFGVILSSLGLVNANCGFPLHEMVTWRWNTRMIVGKHGKLTVSGTILSTVQVRMLGPPFEHKHNDKPVSRLIEQSYQLSHYGSLTCHPGVLHDVLLERINLKKIYGSVPKWWTWIVHANGDAMTLPVTFPGTFPWGAPPDPTWFFSTWFSYTKLPIQHPRSNGSGDWRHLRCLTPRPETFFGNPTGEMGCRVNYQLLGLDRVHLNLHPNPMDYKSYIYIHISLSHWKYAFLGYVSHFHALRQINPLPRFDDWRNPWWLRPKRWCVGSLQWEHPQLIVMWAKQ
jgi:hypothetical protein